MLAASANMEKDEALRQTLQLRPLRQEAQQTIDEAAKDYIELAEQQARANKEMSAKSQLYSLLALAVAAFLSLTFGFFIFNSIVNPVKDVQQIAEALANGDLTNKIASVAKDEIGLMAAALNQAIDNLQALVRRVVETAEQIATSSEELSASTGEVGQATQQVTDTISQLATGTDEQAKAAQTTSQIVEEMSTSIHRSRRQRNRWLLMQIWLFKPRNEAKRWLTRR